MSPDINRLARNETGFDHKKTTIVGDQANKIVEGIRSADGTSFAEPTTTYQCRISKEPCDGI